MELERFPEGASLMLLLGVLSIVLVLFFAGFEKSSQEKEHSTGCKQGYSQGYADGFNDVLYMLNNDDGGPWYSENLENERIVK